MHRGAPGGLRDPWLLGVVGRSAPETSGVGPVASVVEEGRRGAALSIRCRYHTTLDEEARVVAENERVRRLRAPVGECEGHADGDALSVDATDVARTGQARERVEGREDRASVRRVGQALEAGIEREDQLAGPVVER